MLSRYEACLVAFRGRMLTAGRAPHPGHGEAVGRSMQDGQPGGRELDL